MGERGLKCNPGEIWEKYWFLDKFYKKKILKNQGCILEQFFVTQSCSQLNKLSNRVHNSPVYCSFQAFQVHQSRNFQFFSPFFEFGGHFGMKKVLLTYVFFNFFQNPRKISFKIVLLTLYLSFHLKSEKIIFRCRFYQIFFVF